MDARAAGHTVALPHALLEAAAENYLTDAEWDTLGEDWLEQALAYCAAPLRGTRGPLTRIRPRRGAPPTPNPTTGWRTSSKNTDAPPANSTTPPPDSGTP